MNSSKKAVLCSVLLLTLYGCNRYHRWARAQFEQTEYRNILRGEIEHYVQSSDQWDGFTTVGRFDALWYARPVVEWHMQQCTARTGGILYPELAAIRDERLKEIDTYAIFYLLMTDDTGGSLKPQLSLEEPHNANWSVLLNVEGAIYTPLSIKKIAKHLVEPELIALFGPRYDARYRNLYKVAFPRAAVEGRDTLGELTCMKLIMRSVAYEVAIVWDTDTIKISRIYSEHIR